MNGWIVAIIIFSVAGIIFLSSKNTPIRKKTREDFLEELRKFLEGRLEPLAHFENSYRIAFDFEGRAFEFEHIEDKGFEKVHYKAFLKTKTPTDFILNFTEAARATIRSDIVQASNIKEPTVERVAIPKELKGFNIFSNHPVWVNGIFAYDKILDIFLDLRSKGPRGEPIMPIRVQDGVVSLEFYLGALLKPNLHDVHENVAKIENYLDRVALLAEAIEEQAQKRRI